MSAAGTSVVWVASVPLTDDSWEPLARGELIVVRGGVIAGRAQAMAASDFRVDHEL